MFEHVVSFDARKALNLEDRPHLFHSSIVEVLDHLMVNFLQTAIVDIIDISSN